MSDDSIFQDDPRIKVVMRASDIPEQAVVTKRTGTKEYTIRSSITIYNSNGERKELKCDEDSRLLAGPTGDFNVIGGNVELTWLAPIWQLRQVLDDIEEGTPQ